MISPPFLAVCCIARKIAPSSLQEDARIGREQLEVGHALGDQLVHLGQRRVVDVAHDHVEAVVGDGVALGLGQPGVEPLAEGVALGLDGEVDDRRRPAEGRGPRAGLEGVLGERPAERQLHVGVRVDPARDDVLAGRVDRLVRRHRRTGRIAPDLGDGLAVDQDVGLVRAIGRDDRAVGDERAHPFLLGEAPRDQVRIVADHAPTGGACGRRCRRRGPAG